MRLDVLTGTRPISSRSRAARISSIPAARRSSASVMVASAPSSPRWRSLSGASPGPAGDRRNLDVFPGPGGRRPDGEFTTVRVSRQLR